MNDGLDEGDGFVLSMDGTYGYYWDIAGALWLFWFLCFSRCTTAVAGVRCCELYMCACNGLAVFFLDAALRVDQAQQPASSSDKCRRRPKISGIFGNSSPSRFAIITDAPHQPALLSDAGKVSPRDRLRGGCPNRRDYVCMMYYVLLCITVHGLHARYGREACNVGAQNTVIQPSTSHHYCERLWLQ